MNAVVSDATGRNVANARSAANGESEASARNVGTPGARRTARAGRTPGRIERQERRERPERIAPEATQNARSARAAKAGPPEGGEGRGRRRRGRRERGGRAEGEAARHGSSGRPGRVWRGRSADALAVEHPAPKSQREQFEAPSAGGRVCGRRRCDARDRAGSWRSATAAEPATLAAALRHPPARWRSRQIGRAEPVASSAITAATEPEHTAQPEHRPEPAALPGTGAGPSVCNASRHGAGGDQPRGQPPPRSQAPRRNSHAVRAVPARPKRAAESEPLVQIETRSATSGDGLAGKRSACRLTRVPRAAEVPRGDVAFQFFAQMVEKASARFFHQVQHQLEPLVGSVVGIRDLMRAPGAARTRGTGAPCRGAPLDSTGAAARDARHPSPARDRIRGNPRP